MKKYRVEADSADELFDKAARLLAADRLGLEPPAQPRPRLPQGGGGVGVSRSEGVVDFRESESDEQGGGGWLQRSQALTKYGLPHWKLRYAETHGRVQRRKQGRHVLVREEDVLRLVQAG